jgi:hypothetical protein
MANDSPNKKELRAVSFVIHATRGVIRDHRTRRKTMFVLLMVALVLLLSGATFLQSLLSPRVHPLWFVLFWLTCAWLTLTAMLLAIFDMLMVRLEARRADRALRESLKTDSPRSTMHE